MVGAKVVLVVVVEVLGGGGGEDARTPPKLGRGVNRFFSVFGTWFFGKDRGCKSDERGGGCGSGVTVVEVAGGVGMSVGGAGASKRGNAVVIGGWDVGVGGGGAR